MTFRGHRIFIHEDVSAELGRKQAAFKEVKALLYAKEGQVPRRAFECRSTTRSYVLICPGKRWTSTESSGVLIPLLKLMSLD